MVVVNWLVELSQYSLQLIQVLDWNGFLPNICWFLYSSFPCSVTFDFLQTSNPGSSMVRAKFLSGFDFFSTVEMKIESKKNGRLRKERRYRSRLSLLSIISFLFYQHFFACYISYGIKTFECKIVGPTFHVCRNCE